MIKGSRAQKRKIRQAEKEPDYEEEPVKAAPILLVELNDVPQLPLDVLHVDLGVVQDTGLHQAGVKAPCEVGYQA